MKLIARAGDIIKDGTRVKLSGSNFRITKAGKYDGKIIDVYGKTVTVQVECRLVVKT